MSHDCEYLLVVQITSSSMQNYIRDTASTRHRAIQQPTTLTLDALHEVFVHACLNHAIRLAPPCPAQSSSLHLLAMSGKQSI